MVFKKFRNISIFYLVLIVLLTAIGVYIFLETYFWLTSIWIFLIDISIVIIFIKFIGREQRKLSHFLVSINQDDFNPPYIKAYDDVDFNQAFENLSKVIMALRHDAQKNYQYLQTVVNHINTAIICVDASNRIVLSNDSSKKLFDRRVLRDLNSLKISHEDLPSILNTLKPLEKKLVKFKINDKLYNYSIQLADFKLLNDKFRLFSFQNVQIEIEQNELEAWQKLTRVMTHEIMNSAIPISNLSGLVLSKIFNNEEKLLENIENEKEDIYDGLKTIESRSKGLVNFVEATRNFTKMPKPDLEEHRVSDLINRTELLLKAKLTENNISLNVEVEQDDLKIIADKTLIEQVLINMMLNAIDAVSNVNLPQIKISASKNAENHIYLSIEDNGRGIDETNIENIFIPFFTTKKSGSGIGLSLAKQIMFLHKGNISVKSTPKVGTKFVITF